jgi:hypothetical protein
LNTHQSNNRILEVVWELKRKERQSAPIQLADV